MIEQPSEYETLPPMVVAGRLRRYGMAERDADAIAWRLNVVDYQRREIEVLKERLQYLEQFEPAQEARPEPHNPRPYWGE